MRRCAEGGRQGNKEVQCIEDGTTVVYQLLGDGAWMRAGLGVRWGISMDGAIRIRLGEGMALLLWERYSQNIILIVA